MKKTFIWIGVFLIALALSSLACNIGGAAEPTATPVPPTNTPVPDTATPEPTATATATETPVKVEEPTATPTETQEPTEEAEQVPEGMVQVENQTFGIRMAYPEEWYYDDTFFIMLSSDPDVDLMNSDEMPDALVMLAVAGAAEDMDIQTEITDESFEQLAQDISGSADVEIVKGPTEEMINGVPVQILEYSATEEGTTVYGKIAVFDNGDQTGVVIAMSPEEDWDQYADSVDAVLNTVELFEGSGLDLDMNGFVEESVYRGDLYDGDNIEDTFAAGESHAWYFTGKAGQFATFVATPFDEGMDIQMSLVAPDGTILVDVDDNFDQEAEILANYELGEDGDYQIVVSEYAGLPGSYSLEFSLLDEMKTVIPPDALLMASIERGENVEATLEEGQKHAWTFSASAGDIINIHLDPVDEGMDMSFSVLAPDGSYVLEDYDSSFSDESEEYFGLVLDKSGVYTIVVKEFWEITGGYSLMIETGDENNIQGNTDEDYEIVDMGYIGYGESVEASLPDGMIVHRWYFDGNEGDVISIKLSPDTDDADLVLSLVDPDGEEIYHVDDSMSGGDEEILDYTIPFSGGYAIGVVEFYELQSGYTLALNLD